jgi:hypothetical protein
MLDASEIVAVDMDSLPEDSKFGGKTSTLDIPKSLVTGDYEFYRLRLLDESSRLFKEDTDELETLVSPNCDSSKLNATESMISSMVFL